MMVVKRYEISIDNYKYVVELTERRMKNIRLKVKDNILCVSGYHINEKKANNIIYNNVSWIIAQIEKQEKNLSDIDLYGINNFECFYLFGVKTPIIKMDNYYYINNDAFKMNKSFDLNKEYKRIRNYYLDEIRTRVEHYKKVFNRDCVVLYKDMKSKYGYNSYTKNIICLSTRLIHLPKDLIDYIIVHEFCHFIYHNHKKEFQ